MKIRNLAVLISLLWGSYACKKMNETLPAAGAALPYSNGVQVTTARLIDSIADLNIFRVIYRNSDAAHYIDSCRLVAGTAGMPFTLFAPRDAAWQQAGYNLSNAGNLSREQCNALVLYLLTPGRIWGDTLLPVAGSTLLLPAIPGMEVEVEDEWGTIRNQHYTYNLDIAWHENKVLLNGQTAATRAAAINATDGVLYLLDTLIRKPEHTVYETLAADTAYSFYLAALEKSSAIYTDYKAGISPGDRNEELFFAVAEPFNNYLAQLKKFIPAPVGAPNRFLNSYIVFAPDNNAFRKAGFTDIAAIEQFINQSYITTDDYRNVSHAYPMYTNMDSALLYSFVTPIYAKYAGMGIAFSYEQTTNNIYNTLLYTPSLESATLQREGIRATARMEFYDWLTFDENTWAFADDIRTGNIRWVVGKENGVISLRRGDMPGGPVAYLSMKHSNITALNGVIHRIDHLLLRP